MSIQDKLNRARRAYLKSKLDPIFQKDWESEILNHPALFRTTHEVFNMEYEDFCQFLGFLGNNMGNMNAECVFHSSLFRTLVEEYFPGMKLSFSGGKISGLRIGLLIQIT